MQDGARKVSKPFTAAEMVRARADAQTAKRARVEAEPGFDPKLEAAIEKAITTTGEAFFDAFCAATDVTRGELEPIFTDMAQLPSLYRRWTYDETTGTCTLAVTCPFVKNPGKIPEKVQETWTKWLETRHMTNICVSQKYDDQFKVFSVNVAFTLQ